ncbi:extracellular solute-binding protein [Allopusillimonas soli]|uniref:Extracellular solute-binding protein n=1 Tax=Allopusillimonas soli TaxID=659016 RepID=A0A853F730_9BURK|nr:extracellular solute-binding protein [Allopusillimonas soli]NYT36395.1 extracellular solute-binding protein [Allopusillimonas soli]TEA74908.1 extracellular solute-binding protein [Allopusillimonas soli]
MVPNRNGWVRALAAATAAGMFYVAAGAVAADKELVIVTSFATDQTAVFKQAFNKAHPDINVNIINKGTSAGVKYLQETAGNNKTDLFWVSSPDAFEVLKASNLLEKYSPNAKGTASEISGYQIDDPDGYFFGFALSGYGFMWNTRYLESYKLPKPQTWEDLTKPVYFGHLGISAPSRSGTTHLEIETILQAQGWEKGWRTVKEMAGNAKRITNRSFGVPEGVDSGEFGIGIVIDYFGFTSKAAGFPVEFHYPPQTTLVPATIGVVANAPHKDAAHAFVDFVLSPDGQALLFNPKVMRLPVNKEAYKKAPEGIPNPFEGQIKAGVQFNSDLSQARYNVVNSLYDVMVTYRFTELREAVKAINEAQAALKDSTNSEALKLLDEAKALAYDVPITEEKAGDKDFSAIFKVKRKKAEDKVTGRQAEVEKDWDNKVVERYSKAQELANKARSMA